MVHYLFETKTYLWGGSRTAQAICSKGSHGKIAIDNLGPLPKTVSDNAYIMVISDYFTD